MRINLRAIALLLATMSLLGLTGTGLADDDAPAQTGAEKSNPDNNQLIAQGKELYHRMPCVRCHGGNCVQNSSAAFDLRTFPHNDKARFVNSVTNGKNGRMPPWGDVLKPEEIDQLWAYVQSVSNQ
jgi:mono/diheme cytochrome c family protein